MPKYKIEIEFTTDKELTLKNLGFLEMVMEAQLEALPDGDLGKSIKVSQVKIDSKKVTANLEFPNDMVSTESLDYAFANDFSPATISKKVHKVYDKGMQRDWDLSELDEVVDEFLDSDSAVDIFTQIRTLHAEQAKELWNKFEKIARELEEADLADELEVGDYVDFGSYGKLYVCSLVASSKGERYCWVTDQEEDRFNPKARGWSILKSLAEKVIEKGSDLDPEDYREEKE